MAWQKFSIYFLWSIILYSLCTDKLYAPATVHLKQFVYVCHFKVFSCTMQLQLHSQQEYTIDVCVCLCVCVAGMCW